MSERLFINLYLDEDVDVLVAKLLTHRGYQARTTRKAENLGRSDREQLAYAAQHKEAILTHNRRDFEALAVEYY